jgi:hypothetical protein
LKISQARPARRTFVERDRSHWAPGRRLRAADQRTRYRASSSPAVVAAIKGSAAVKGAVRRGQLLLPGPLRCGHCGRKLHVSYSGKLGRYNCYGARANHGTARCISIGGLGIDAAVSKEVLRILKALGIDAAVKAIEIQTSETSAAQRQLELSLQQARYEAAHARRQGAVIDTILHWHGGDHTALQLKLGLNAAGRHRWPVPEDTMSLVRELARLMPDRQIARLLNRSGKHPVSRRIWQWMDRAARTWIPQTSRHSFLPRWRMGRARRDHARGSDRDHRRQQDDGSAHDSTGRRQGTTGLQGRTLGHQVGGHGRVQCPEAITRFGNTKSCAAGL